MLTRRSYMFTVVAFFLLYGVWVLARAARALQVQTALRFGKPGPEIVNFAKDGTFDSILMTRSSRGSTQKLGSVSTYVVHNASFITTTVLRET